MQITTQIPLTFTGDRSTWFDLKKSYKANVLPKESNMQNWWTFIANIPNDQLTYFLDYIYKIEKRLKDFKTGFYYTTKIRKYISEYLYTDVEAYEVVKVCTPNKVIIRKLDTKQTVFPKEFYPGGFSGHYADNYNQDYEYISNEANAVAPLFKGKKGWGNGRFRMSDTPYKFHDYNF